MAQLSVLDLPQLYTKPSADTLLKTLALLTSAPPSWDRNNPQASGEDVPTPSQIDPEGVTRYLTSIVSNSLKWIDDEVKEEIWTQASARLAERSGRTARGDLSRLFRIPTSTGLFELSIHEPALTGDDLGLKTWAASYMLAKRLHALDILSAYTEQPPQVLELGSGTGLVGLAMAGLGADVVLTDMLSIHSNLKRNAESNSALIEARGGSTRTGVLDWTDPRICTVYSDDLGDRGEQITAKFPFILAADSLYSPDHPSMLVKTIETWLSREKDAKVIVEFPYREAYLPEITDFRNRMAQVGLQILEEGEEKGFDDWGSATTSGERDDDALVTCWWSIWVWS
ncbi:putative methyltransferase-domain-containing protein [Paraphoma chrysanthemicola]|nr:putative methyltransferase-domain-containing protein [Paraphoma chrysanthemicola]